MLEERKRKILETYQVDGLDKKATSRFEKITKRIHPPGKLKADFHRAVHSKQVYLFEQLWYRSDREFAEFSGQVLHAMESLSDLYQVDELFQQV